MFQNSHSHLLFSKQINFQISDLEAFPLADLRGNNILTNKFLLRSDSANTQAKQILKKNKLLVSETNKKNTLEENPFDFKVLKDKLQITWNGKSVIMLKGSAAQKLIKKIEMTEGIEVQLILAKITGNFKRGNEKNPNKSD